MNDSEIIKALATSSDPNNLNCQPTTKLCKEALDLINRQQTEIDTMKDTMAKLLNTLERANKYGLGADERVEQLKIELEKAKSEAVREFAERMLEEINALNYQDYNNYLDTIDAADRLLEEMGCNDG